MFDYGIFSANLSDQYVFYERLRSDGADGRPRLANLYKNVTSAMGSVFDAQADNRLSVAGELYAQSRAQAEKEVAALNHEFGLQLTMSQWLLDRPAFYKDLIEALNVVLTNKKIFERNLERLMYSGKSGTVAGMNKVDVSKFFREYFQKELSAKKDNLLPSGLAGMSQQKIIQHIEQELTYIIVRAVRAMYESDAFNPNWNVNNTQQVNKDTAGAYQEILDSLNQMRGRANPIINGIWNSYNFSGLASDLANALIANKQTKKAPLADKLASQAKTILSTKRGAAGLFAEIQQVVLAEFAEAARSANVEVRHTGNKNNQIADVTLASFSVDIDRYLQIQESQIHQIRSGGEDSVRLQNKIATSAAVKYMAENRTDYGFLAYVNMKNYDLNTIKSFGGFSAGEPTSLRVLQATLDMLPSIGQAETLIGALLQFGEGAIGRADQEQEILNGLVEAIATFLFDDIGHFYLYNQPSGLNTVHLFWLSGLYVPASFFLEIVARALEGAIKDAEDVFRFNLSSPSIIYGSEEIGSYTHEMWVEQRSSALDKTTVTLNFLKNFQSLIVEYFG